MKPLTIEIHGTGTHNRGAELMAIAASDHLRAAFPGVRIVVSRGFGTAEDLKRHGFKTTWEVVGKLGRLRSFIASWSTRSDGNLVSPREVDVVLDASGFAFSDQWGEGRPRKLVKMMSRRYRRRQPLVLLPQALGPFEHPGVAKWTRDLFRRARLVCARDIQSHKRSKELFDAKYIRRYPDFTVAVRPSPPAPSVLPGTPFAAIVPNIRMLDKTDSGDVYLEFLRQALTRIRETGLNPLFVLHDSKDDRLVLEKLGACASNVPVVTDPDPRVLKGILGRAHFVIGSRFHALVSALSQGVPCIGAGWSHKYPELFRDFACPEYLIHDLTDTPRLAELVQSLADLSSHQLVSQKVYTAAEALKKQTEAMWSEVESVIRSVS